MIGSYYQNGKPKNQRNCDKKAKQIKTIWIPGTGSVSYGGFYNCHFESGCLILWNCYAGANWHFAIPEDNVNELGEYFTGIPNKQYENEQLF
ncbi:MAG: hypothetical protein RRZ64_00140 [Rikenellaceae bacterium]